TTADITPIVLTASGAAANKVYDRTTTATITSCTLAGVIAGDTVTCSAGGPNTFNTKNVGTGKTVTATGISLSGVDAGNYTVNGSATTTADITAKTVTVSGVTADDKVYDATTAAAVNISGATLSGVIAPDVVNPDASGATGVFSDKNVGTAKTVTITGVTISGADAAN